MTTPSPAGNHVDETEAPYALAVVVPTRNEAHNVAAMVAGIDAALAGVAFEIIFVDDWSTDRTAERVAAIAATRRDIRVLRRFGRHGLSGAAIEGMMATMAPVVAVIDGDGQHDHAILPRLYDLVRRDAADVAIGSRYCAGGSSGTWNPARRLGSRAATRLSRLALRTPVADPMSGFFVIRRKLVETLLPMLSGRGFKILFDLLSSSPTPLRATELPYTFRPRIAGDSKLGMAVLLDYLVMVADRAIRHYLPSRFTMFAAVGTLGLCVHVATLRILLAGAGMPFAHAQAGALLVAMLFNFFANNSFTFRDRRLRGTRLWVGLASFVALCGLGALANLGTGTALFAAHERWWVSGIAGAVVGTAWNFIAAVTVTWRRRR